MPEQSAIAPVELSAIMSASSPGKALKPVQIGYRLLREFLRVYPFGPGKSLAGNAAYRLFGFAEVKTRFGMRMRVHPNEVLGRRILCTGFWEPEITALFGELLSPGDVVLDIGANIGYFTLLASKLVRETGKVLAFEPQSSNRALLLENILLNGAQNVQVFAMGLADQNGEARLYRGTPRNPGLSSIRPAQNGPSERIELRRGDEIISRDLWQRVRLIKMDIEGAELSALRGLFAVLATNAAINLLVEVTPSYLEEMGDSEEGLLTFLRELGYAMRIVTEGPAYEVRQYDAWFARA